MFFFSVPHALGWHAGAQEQAEPPQLCVKLGDFGLSIFSHQQSPEVPSSECEHRIPRQNSAGVGTFTYAAPEQIYGSKYNSSVDIFALGVMLVESFSAPFSTAMERLTVLSKARKGSLPPHFEKQHPAIAEAARLCLANPEDRPTAEELLNHSAFQRALPFLRSSLANLYFNLSVPAPVETDSRSVSRLTNTNTNPVSKLQEMFGSHPCHSTPDCFRSSTQASVAASSFDSPPAFASLVHSASADFQHIHSAAEDVEVLRLQLKQQQETIHRLQLQLRDRDSELGVHHAQMRTYSI
mmetsp:Transcript_28435/g.39972  ORF Transcript_28435/g.39972 Transcript_28435/m.39972 type:complete len:296 (-) Transcript_28435:44-931(-)